MEIYSDIDYQPKLLRSGIIIICLCLIPFQLPYVFSDALVFSRFLCGLTSSIMIASYIFLFTKQGEKILYNRIYMFTFGCCYFIYSLSMLILTSVIVPSKSLFDSSFYMFAFLNISILMGILSGKIFNDNNYFKNSSINIKVRGNEIEIRKVDVLGGLSFSKMPFLRKPLIKVKNVIVVLAFVVGTGGAGIAMGIAELLTRSDILSPDLDTHSVLFFIFGVPVLFTFGVIVYAMMSYLSEWRKLVANIDKEYGEHVIIFNSKKKSYKKIKEIMAESGSNPNG
ncbi:hypothetical protein F0225_18795 [Vibrio pectenicida]|uniref:Uncharacterized protein n=2 Tax=Vibrio pectenicida TaxID=62763 RepID=A0A7Y4A2Q2_9VIBR|nr:hypothetical protein [Vibrio pectenicida]